MSEFKGIDLSTYQRNVNYMSLKASGVEFAIIRAGFGKNGEGFFRLTSFGDRDKTIEAVRRIKALLS